jgi:hypothetical protein
MTNNIKFLFLAYVLHFNKKHMFERFKTGAKRPIQAYLDKVYNHGKGLILTQGTNGYNHSTKKGSKSFFIVYK